MSSPEAVGLRRQPPSVGEGLELAKLRVAPLAFLQENAQRFGDIFRYSAGNWDAVVLNHPSYVRRVLHADASSYCKAGTPDLMMLRPMLGDGLMTSEGESWARQRMAAQPEFQRSRVDGYVPHMNRVVAAMLDRWSRYAASGAVVDIESEMSRLTLEIVAQCLFGAQLGAEQGDFGAAVATMNEYMGHFDPTDFPRLLKFQEAVMLLDRIVNRVIEERLAHPAVERDLLSALIEHRTEEGGNALRDQIFTFLMAGHETTAKTLTWTLYLLSTYPEALECAAAEAERVLGDREPAPGDIEQLAYSWMTLQEAMRIYPPVWLMSRQCRNGDSIDGFEIPAGALVVISPYIMHRHPRYWSDPEVFDPRRFEQANVSARVPYTYFPFSGGPRACIGRTFATVEMIVVLASILRRFRLRLLPNHPVEPDPLVTLRPKFGMPMTIEPVL